MGKKNGKRAAPPVSCVTLEPGDGVYPREGQSLTVHYTGTLAADGSEFDSSRVKGVPFTFVLGAGKVIKGWELGLASMSLGQRCRLAISAEAGYGKRGCEDRANSSGTGEWCCAKIGPCGQASGQRRPNGWLAEGDRGLGKPS